MKKTYPIILTPDGDGFAVHIPDFDADTQGDDLTEAIEMARDAIGLLGIDLEDDKKPLPTPSPVSAVKRGEGDIVSLVDVDFAEYRRKNELRVVKKNCSLPGWLCWEAEKANLNFSQLLQAAIRRELNITDR